MPFSIRTLAMTLAHATPEQQRELLGENLYPLVEKLEPRAAPKVTGMLLELDRIEVLNLIQSPSALKSKVYQAMEVLRSVAHPSNLRALMGETLYPLVEELEPHTAPKVTGMLLELDPTEVFNLIQSPSALKSKVYEAMQVLRSVAHPSLVSIGAWKEEKELKTYKEATFWNICTNSGGNPRSVDAWRQNWLNWLKTVEEVESKLKID